MLKEGFLGQKMIVLPKSIKKRLESNKITRSFYITDIGYYPRARHHQRVRKMGANEFIFIYCTEGGGTLNIAGEHIEVLPNHFYIIPKNTAHGYHAGEHNPWSIYWMHFGGIMAQSLFDRYDLNRQNAEIVPFESSRIHEFNRIFQVLNSSYVMSRLEYANILGLNFISSFIFAEIGHSMDVQSRDNLVDTIVEFLVQNLDKSLRFEDITEEFNYSSSYLFNLFKKRTGYSPLHFFNLKKTQKACEILDHTDMSIKEISYKLGFQDPLYFSRLFKKYMGVSPRTYRLEQRS